MAAGDLVAFVDDVGGHAEVLVKVVAQSGVPGLVVGVLVLFVDAFQDTFAALFDGVDVAEEATALDGQYLRCYLSCRLSGLR